MLNKPWKARDFGRKAIQVDFVYMSAAVFNQSLGSDGPEKLEVIEPVTNTMYGQLYICEAQY